MNNLEKLLITDEEINIIQLNYPDNVRVRPGKMIGSVDNPDVILREAVDNAIDELYGSKKANKIHITIPKIEDQYYVVADNGRGIPIIWDEENKKTKCELAVATIDAGSKFSKTINNIATGQNGVGISCTNALSDHFIILSRVRSSNWNLSIPEVKTKYEKIKNTQKLYYYLEYKRGIKCSEGCMTRLEVIAKWGFEFEEMSTIVAFKPDSTIFKSTNATYSKTNLRYIKTVTELFYQKSTEIVINGKLVSNDFEPYKFEFTKPVEVKTYDEKIKTAKFYINFELDKNIGTIDITGSINSLPVDRGLHINFIKDAYSDALRRVYNLNHNYILNGLKLNTIVMCGEVDFASQTKERCTKLDDLYSTEVVPILSKEFQKIIKNNQDEFDIHVLRLNEYADSLNQISTINKVKSMVVIAGDDNSRVRSKIPVNVHDASTQNRKEAELYIVEGKSASGTILKSRDRKTQAVLSLRGVPMNAINVDLDTLLENEEMKNIISAIGAGVNEYFKVESSRYGKIIISADADSDGHRIASLIAGMIARKMTFLIKEGMVYILESPLYIQNGNFFYKDDEINLDKNKPFTRLKGLGEINVDQAEIIITGKDTRKLKQLTIDGVESAIEMLTSSAARKQLMIDSKILIDPYNLGLWA
jgi:DNA gyrase/topoisomerase IV subunit B